jgi:hypothetical protein
MALPVLSNNTPSAGYISWTAFNIEYNGVGYPVAAGNTNKAYVYWKYNAGVPTIVTTDTKPVEATITADDWFLFLNKLGIAMYVDNANVVDGSLIINGSVYAAALAADQISTRELAAGAVIAENVQAGAITADKLGIGTVGNSLVTNGYFEEYLNGLPIGWTGSITGTATVDVVTGVAASGASSARLGITNVADIAQMRQTPDKLIPVSAQAGRKWYITCRAGAGTTGVTRGFYVRALWYDANKVYQSYSEVITPNQGVPNNWDTVFDGQVTPPSTAKYMGVEFSFSQPNIAANLYVDEVSAMEVIVSARISDGAITTPKLSAGAVTADKILVTDRTNFWENPDFEDDVVGLVPRGILPNSGSCRTLGAGAQGSAKSLELDALNGVNNDVYGLDLLPVKPGDKYFINYDYKFLNTVGTGTAGVGFRGYGPTKAPVSWYNAAPITTKVTTWTNTSAAPPTPWTVPAGVYYIQAWVTFQNNAETTNRFHVDNIIIRRMNGGELIVDGAISGQTITGAELNTKPDAQTGVYAQIGQFIVSNASGTDRPGYGFVKPNSTAYKIGMFSEDGSKLSLVGSRAISNGPADATLDLDKDESKLFNYNKVTISTGALYQSSEIDILSGGNVYINTGNGSDIQNNGRPVLTREAWQPMTLAGVWVNYSGGGGYLGGLRARRIGNNVQIQGMVKSGAGTIATLPTDCRPQFSAIRPVIAAGAAAQITVSNDGTISYLAGPAAPSYVSINEILPL